MNPKVKSAMITALVGALITALAVISGIYSQIKSMDRAVPKIVHFGHGDNGIYSLINTQTGESSSFLPEGYSLLDQHEYQTFPTFLILQKNNELYSYNVETKNWTAILDGSEPLTLKNNEQPRLFPSITEKNKFLIQIDELDLNNISDFSGLPAITSLASKTYSFDATTNVLAKVDFGGFTACAKYDSANQRFFTWTCEEGVGNIPPLSIYDLATGSETDLITLDDFDPATNEWAKIEYDNGTFLIWGNGKDKIITINATLPAPEEKIFSVTKNIADQFEYPYSMAIDQKTKTIISGGANGLSLLRFNSKNQMVETVSIEDKGIYANFMFVLNGKLYYQAKENIRIVNLESGKIEKSIPSLQNFSEITLFNF